MRRILNIAIGFGLINSYSFAQTLLSYSSKLLLPKNLNSAYSRMNSQNSQGRFGQQILSRPYGISAFVYNDDPTCTEGDMDLIGVADANWDRCWIYKKDGSGEDMVFRGGHGVNSFQFASPRGIVGLPGMILVTDAYNNKVHVYRGGICPLYEQFVGFDSLARPSAVQPATSLRDPMGIDRVSYQVTGIPNELWANHYAVADYGNNRVCIFPASTETRGPTVAPGRALETFGFNKPTAVAYGWDKATGKQKNHLFVVSQGNGDIYWLQMNTNALDVDELVVLKTVKLDFDQLVFNGQALPNYFLSSATVDNHNMLWVLDANNGVVYKFWPKVSSGDSLILVGSWGGIGTADGQLYYPNAMAAQHGIIDQGGIITPMTNLHDILITETWGPETGIRRFSIGVEAFVDSSRYVAKSDSGGGNAVFWWHHFTDYVNVTEKVFKGSTLIQTVTNNQEMPPRSSFFGLWNVGTNDSGTYRIEITANSLYCDASDVKNFTVFVDTTRRNNAPSVTQDPYYVHPEWNCFFPSGDYFLPGQPLKPGGDFVKVTATDPDSDPLTYAWTVDPDLGSVGPRPGYTGQSSYSTTADSIFYAVPDVWPWVLGLPQTPTTDCEGCLELTVTDPAGNWIKKTGVSLKSPCQRGDLDANGYPNPADVVYLIIVVFMDVAPPPYGDYKAMSDINCDGQNSPVDLVMFLQIVFLGAAAPC